MDFRKRQTIAASPAEPGDLPHSLGHLIQLLNNTGVRPALLKGAAALVGGLCPTPGERMIGDIDVLIPPSRLAGTVKHLRAAGYQPVAVEDELPETEDFGLKIHHYPRIYSLDWPVAVELHVHPVHLPVARLLGGEEVVRDATQLIWRGGDCLLPSPTHFVMHNVIHAFDDIRVLGILSLRQLFEFVYASRTYDERIDWAVIQHRFDSLRYGRELRGYATLANAYLGFQVPPVLPVSGFAKLQRRFYRNELEHPAMHFLFSLGRFLRMLGWIVRTRISNQLSNPRNMKKLFRAGFYVRLYLEARDGYRSVHN